MNLMIAILNFNQNTNAQYLQMLFSQFGDSYIFDSGSSKQCKEFIKSDTPFYTGNFNKASDFFLNGSYSWCLYICADVIMTQTDAMEMFNRISDVNDHYSDIGCYSPAIRGKCVPQMLKKNRNKYRKVFFVEGIIFAANKKIIQRVHPINPKINSRGHGIDVIIGYEGRKIGLKSVVDDSIEVYHPPYTSYEISIADIERKNQITQSKLGFKIFDFSYRIDRIIGKYKRKFMLDKVFN